MPKKTSFPPPKEDVPAWFMTYSDVVTLLMTFFILLLTFATMEPEKFEQVQSALPAAQSATGKGGKETKTTATNAWVNRIRPSSARIALRGAEMPPITYAPVRECMGKGMKALKENELQHNELETHHFDIELNQLFDRKGNLTPQGEQILAALAIQLRDLPFQAALQYSDPRTAESVIKVMIHMFELEKIRPGQLGMTLVRDTTLSSQHVRILVKRFLVAPQ